MAKQKYYYNISSLRYEKVKVSWTRRLMTVFTIICTSLVFAVAIVYLIQKFIPSANEKRLQNELAKMEAELKESRYKIEETENINKNLKEEVNSVQTELQSTKEQLEQILKNKKMFVKKIDELSQETDAMLGEFDKW